MPDESGFAMTNEIGHLYPDLISAGSLARSLQQMLVEIGSSLEVRSFEDLLDSKQKDEIKGFPAYARIEHGERFSQIYMALKERLFLFDFWRRGVMLANATTPDLKAVAASIHRWIADSVTICDLSQEYPFVKPVDSAEAFESGAEVEHRWTSYENSIPTSFPELLPFLDVAKRTPELRQLFPFTSLNRMCFSRCTGYPYTDDCPVITPLFIGDIASGQYEVRLRGRLLGKGNGSEAAEIVVRHLPSNCGPAVAGTAETI